MSELPAKANIRRSFPGARGLAGRISAIPATKLVDASSVKSLL